MIGITPLMKLLGISEESRVDGKLHGAGQRVEVKRAVSAVAVRLQGHSENSVRPVENHASHVEFTCLKILKHSSDSLALNGPILLYCSQGSNCSIRQDFFQIPLK